jgi:hypothetical protein
MAEDGHVETKRGEGEMLTKGYTLYVGKSKDGVTFCDLKEQKIGGMNWEEVHKCRPENRN